MLFIYLYHGELYSDLWKVTCMVDPPIYCVVVFVYHKF